jgi:ribosomal-protein-alanine N-acetyltransferase
MMTLSTLAPNITIRHADLADIAELIALENDCFADAWTQSTLNTALTDEKTFVLVAEDEAGKICGYATAWVILDEGELTRVAVFAENRGRGIGRVLTKAILELCRNHGAQTMFLEVRESNTTAQRLYERCGFSRAGLRRGYYADGEDAVIMRNSLRF